MPSLARLSHVTRPISAITSAASTSSTFPRVSALLNRVLPRQSHHYHHQHHHHPAAATTASHHHFSAALLHPPCSPSAGVVRRLCTSTSTSTSVSVASNAAASTAARSRAAAQAQALAMRRHGRSKARQEEIRRRNNNLLAWALTIVLATIGLSYASVPLYRVFCQVTGFGGTLKARVPTSSSSSSSTSPATKKRGATTGTDAVDDDDDDDDYDNPYKIDETRVVADRPLKIRFNADVSAGVPWRFTPEQTQVVVLPGESVLAFYYAENRSPHAVTGIATYNVTPAKAAVYFNKVQCFCFDEQRLKPGEGLDMPVFFYIDPDFADDRNMDDVRDIMLSYTFFKAEDVTPEQLLRAQQLAGGGSQH